MSSQADEIMIASLDPYFLEREPVWFTQTADKIKKAARLQIWWKENTIFLETDSQINLYQLLRQLTEFGYQKTQTLGAPGEFSQRGGILDVAPINSDKAWRLEFRGNRINQITELPLEILRSQKSIKKELRGRAAQSLTMGPKPGDWLVHLDHGIGVFAGFAKEPGAEISTKVLDQETKESFFVVDYAKGDRLYVPLRLEEKLSRYIGFEAPIVHRLGGALWFKTKRRVKEDIIKTAQELLQIYARRAAARGFKYPPDDEMQKALEADFPYVETDDQQKAIEEVKRDMESEKPMDRLICGDVGFGKTEVALRAALKAVSGGRQTALLSPTTILARQHWRNFAARLEKFPVKIALLSRLESKKLQQKIVQEIREGKIDIVIGTHRLLQKDIIFKNLGLLITDEEQRFGVKQKEFFKGLRDEPVEVMPQAHPKSDINGPTGKTSCGIDILSLTATPIPRTMNLALAGLRDVSIIETPPPGRLAVKTFIEPYSPETIKTAIEKELARPVRGFASNGARGGQVYFLHNRIETIGLVKKQIEKLLHDSSPSKIEKLYSSPSPQMRRGLGHSAPSGLSPRDECLRASHSGHSSLRDSVSMRSETLQGQTTGSMRRDAEIQNNTAPQPPPQLKRGIKHPVIAIAHGRLNEKQLIKVMDDFGAGKIDILLATTIIENGLDLPNVNTLIVDNATKLGLAQSYQLRGRIGRSNIQAYGYFLYNAKNLTEVAQQRLDALKEAEALGSGYQIALRDLEIRGAGNILGREQSGQINAIGLNLYIQMLNEAVEELKLLKN